METVHHRPGTPCWVELVTPDLAASLRFYSTLFGWDGGSAPAGGHGYATFTLRGGAVAGAAGLPDAPAEAVWHTYFSSADLVATTLAVEAAGGTVVDKPRQVMDLGRTAFYTAPDGAGFGGWQPGTRLGYAPTGGLGAPVRFELDPVDPERATRFYAGVLGWDGPDAAGPAHITPRDTHRPAELPTQWTPHFAAVNADRAAAQVVALGGEVLCPPTTPGDGGRFAVLRDPQGAMFCVTDGTAGR